MAHKTLLAIDQGTTSSRSILFSEFGEVLDIAQKELEIITPHSGWVEQDPKHIWDDVLQTANVVLKRANVKPTALGITNQRETTIIWDRSTGEPLYNAIVWQDRRTADLCNRLRAEGFEELITDKTGLLLDPYFSATKIAWILDNVNGARERAEKGELAFGTSESWVIWNLTGGKKHVSDATNASRTMLYNIREQCWDNELLEMLDIPKSLLPEVLDNVADFGVADALNQPLKICGAAGDQQAALIGQACFDKGMVKSTYGTGCFALMNIGSEFSVSKNRLLTTCAYCLNGNITYALEGSVFIAGAAIQWLRDGLQLFGSAPESEALALSVKDNGGVYMVPAFTGLGAPYWEPEVRGLICGLGRETEKAHIARAALEAQAYQTLDLIGAMCDDSGVAIDTIRIDGGLSRNDFMCSFLSDILNRDVEVPKVNEATAWGAAVLAAIGIGVFEDFEDAKTRWQRQKLFQSSMTVSERDKLCQGWKEAILKVRS